MEERFKSKYRIPSTRRPNWDYGSSGLYYITICTKNREHYFGNIIEQNTETQNIASLQATEIGEFAYDSWLAIPEHFGFVELDDFVIMPNHIHSILYFNKPDKYNWEINKFGVQSQNLAAVIRGYKAGVKAYATNNNIEFSWQPRYHDRVIRDEKEYSNIREYIFRNPEQWLLNGDKEDDLYKKHNP